jgi:hypothetical protein
MARRAVKSSGSLPVKVIDKALLRDRIIEEDHLQQSIARDEVLRNEHPDLWQRADAARLARNKAQDELNRKLRAAGCKPVMIEPSLKQKMKKLQQLQAQNRAETASFRKRS